MAADTNGSDAAAQERSLLDSFLKPAKPVDATDTYADGIIPYEHRKAAMQSLNRVEVRMGYIAAAVAVFMGGFAILIFPRTKLLTTKPKNGSCPAAYTLIKGTCEQLRHTNYWVPVMIVMIFALAIFVSVRIRRRTPTMFSSFMAGLGLSTFGIEVGAPILIYGGWLLLRARRIQKYGTTDAKEVAVLAGEERAARKAGKPSPQAQARAKTSPGATPAKGKSAPASSVPEASKRYTPKVPIKKRPPPPPPEEKKPSRWRARLEGLDQEG
jgi:hypothetical protein